MEASMKILRLKAVLARTGLSRATIYRYMNLNEFPQAIKLGLRSVGWAEHEVEAWLQERIQLRDGFFHR
ncbi:AlpA family transcriptional regulator [Halopseudomonas aestusnigri]|uniref:helix-turn-helix transcriptional regulator n=1 Tax=Halopseudomonas aestusnigri TaxID=857252 RepID=UPI0030C7194B